MRLFPPRSIEITFSRPLKASAGRSCSRLTDSRTSVILRCRRGRKAPALMVSSDPSENLPSLPVGVKLRVVMLMRLAHAVLLNEYSFSSVICCDPTSRIPVTPGAQSTVDLDWTGQTSSKHSKICSSSTALPHVCGEPPPEVADDAVAELRIMHILRFDATSICMVQRWWCVVPCSPGIWPTWGSQIHCLGNMNSSQNTVLLRGFSSQRKPDTRAKAEPVHAWHEAPHSTI